MSAHVLVPVDDSDQSDAALEFALSEYPDARLTALHVVDPAEIRGGVALESFSPESYGNLQDQQENRAKQILESATRRAEQHERTIETVQMVGTVVHSIVTYAGAHDIDHIVIGSHGRSGPSRILLGSVAEKVTRRSPVPVTIVR
ncbi:universal stress protein UspA (plasmid) [Halostagnicola larsenii XH-48]|uniref:Universal stress protein UspA n=1 Tax=Halostagnicola larsenii XH-48 TaxID=797299 RepID=W0JUZ4_9EURY|nr:universal stress protein [Halostagnicola larsenii]AHG02359.1 universal stress protein UspA [Halostagnicola larsenii XH-48]